MSSIYHYFKNLIKNKEHFLTVDKLQEFPFDPSLLSCNSEGVFPDMAIRINTADKDFTGGELIELKDSKSYTVSSFNSTIPSGKKKIANVITAKNSRVKQQMEEAGDDISDEMKEKLLKLFGVQESFSKVRHVEKASVKLRFRIMTEVKAEGNILNPKNTQK